MSQNINILKINGQDGAVSLMLEEGGYAITDGRISISVSAEATAEDQENEDLYPTYGCICLEGFPLDGEIAIGDTYEHSGGMHVDDPDAKTKAHGYFGFHVEEIKVKWIVLDIECEVIKFQLEAIHDDPDYYDENAEITPTNGIFRLGKQDVSELWIPG